MKTAWGKSEGDHKGGGYILILLTIFAISFLFGPSLTGQIQTEVQAAVTWPRVGNPISGGTGNIRTPSLYVKPNALLRPTLYAATVELESPRVRVVAKSSNDNWGRVGQTIPNSVAPGRLTTYSGCLSSSGRPLTGGCLALAVTINQGASWWVEVYYYQETLAIDWLSLGNRFAVVSGSFSRPVIEGFVEYNGQLFMAVASGENEGRTTVYRFDGTNWQFAGNSSTGLEETRGGSNFLTSSDLIVFNNQLYLSGRTNQYLFNNLPFYDAALFIYNGGTNWSKVAQVRASDSSPNPAGAMTVYNNSLYVNASGAGVYRLEGSNLVAVGDRPNGFNPMDIISFNNNLYVSSFGDLNSSVWVYCPASNSWVKVDNDVSQSYGAWGIESLAILENELYFGTLKEIERPLQPTPTPTPPLEPGVVAAAVFRMTGGDGTEYCPAVLPTPTTAVDIWPPLVTINDLGCFAPGQLGLVSGTASDQGSGVQQVQVALQNLGSGLYYDFGSGIWTGASEDWAAAVDISGNGSWSSWQFNLATFGGFGPLGPLGKFRIWAQALDKSGLLSIKQSKDFDYQLTCGWVKAVDGEIYGQTINVSVPAAAPPPNNLRWLVDDSANNLVPGAVLKAGGVAMARTSLAAGGRVSERGSLPGWQVVGQEQIWPVDNGWLKSRCQAGPADCLYYSGDVRVVGGVGGVGAGDLQGKVMVVEGDITIGGEVTEVEAVLVAVTGAGGTGGKIIVEDSGAGQLRVIGGLYTQSGFDFSARQALGNEAAVEVVYAPGIWSSGLNVFGQTESYKFEEIE